LLIFHEVTDKTKLAPFFMAHGVYRSNSKVNVKLKFTVTEGKLCLLKWSLRPRVRAFWFSHQHVSFMGAPDTGGAGKSCDSISRYISETINRNIVTIEH